MNLPLTPSWIIFGLSLGTFVACSGHRPCKEGDRQCLTRCEGGERPACVSWGRMLLEGNGTPPDPVQALAVFQATCNAGWGAACLEAGKMIDAGVVGPADATDALALFHRGCDSKSPEACRRAATRYREGRGAAANAAQAALLFEKACYGADLEACLALGDMYRLHDPPHRPAALRWYSAACGLRSREGCRLAASMREK